MYSATLQREMVSTILNSAFHWRHLRVRNFSIFLKIIYKTITWKLLLFIIFYLHTVREFVALCLLKYLSTKIIFSASFGSSSVFYRMGEAILHIYYIQYIICMRCQTEGYKVWECGVCLKQICNQIERGTLWLIMKT